MLYVLGVALSLSIVVVAVLGLVGHAGSTISRFELDTRAECALNAVITRARANITTNLGLLPYTENGTIDGFVVTAAATDNSAAIANSIRIDAKAVQFGRTWYRTSYVGKSKTGSSVSGTATRTSGGGLFTYLKPVTPWTAPYQYLAFARLVRLDQQFAFNGSGSNFVTGKPEGWYAESVGWLDPPVSGNYTFRILCDDSCRLWVNGQLLIDYWGQSAATYRTGKTISLTADTPVAIRMEFVDFGGGAADVLEWTYPGQSYQTVPSSVLTPAGMLPGTPAAYQFEVDPKSTFLRATSSTGVAMPLCIDLWSLGYSAGQSIKLTACNGWNSASGGLAVNDNAGLIGCFASTPDVSSSTSTTARITNPVSYGSGNDFVPGWSSANIAQDFWIGTSGNRNTITTVTIPTNGQYLFVGIPDSAPGDNGATSDGMLPVVKVQR